MSTVTTSTGALLLKAAGGYLRITHRLKHATEFERSTTRPQRGSLHTGEEKACPARAAQPRAVRRGGQFAVANCPR